MNEDWEHRYQTKDMPWEKGAPSPGLVDFLSTSQSLPRARRSLRADLSSAAQRFGSDITAKLSALEFNLGDGFVREIASPI